MFLLKQILPRHFLGEIAESLNQDTLRPDQDSNRRGGPRSNPGLVMWDFVMDKSGVGAGFLRELGFPLLIYIPSASSQSSSLPP
jgi:hypothetical protein